NHSLDSEARDFPDDLAGAWSKMKAHAARFALILSRLWLACDPIADPYNSPVDADRVRGAVSLVDFFKSQTRRTRRAITCGGGRQRRDGGPRVDPAEPKGRVPGGGRGVGPATIPRGPSRAGRRARGAARRGRDPPREGPAAPRPRADGDHRLRGPPRPAGGAR